MEDRMSDLHQAELAVIGSAILTAGRSMEDQDFNPADFKSPVFEHAYRTIDQMRRDGKPIDQLTVSSELRASDVPVDLTIPAQAVDATPSAGTGSYYAGIVTDHATRRRVADVGRQIAALAESPGEADAIVEEARRVLDSTVRPSKAAPVRWLWETIDDTMQSFQHGNVYIPTPWPTVNEIIGGLRPGALYTVGARPSVGKSVIGVELALEMAKRGSVALFSLEMSQDDVNKRVLAKHCRIDMNRLMNPEKLTPDDYHRIGQFKANYRNALAVSQSEQITITEIRRFSRTVDRHKPLAGIVVDYLQLMSQAPQDKRGRQDFVADMSRQLKLLAMDMQVPVLMLSQLNRQSENRDDKMPRISDLRESGAVEQDSDVVILLHRELGGPGAEKLLLSVAKNRHGQIRAAELAFAGHFSEVREKEQWN